MARKGEATWGLRKFLGSLKPEPDRSYYLVEVDFGDLPKQHMPNEEDLHDWIRLGIIDGSKEIHLMPRVVVSPVPDDRRPPGGR